MKLWRLATTTRNYRAEDLSGAGAAKNPGRWNAKGQYVVYAAPTIALAVLETAAHVDVAGLPLNRYLVEIEVPDSVWALRRRYTAAELPGGWDAIPSAHASERFGSIWYADGSTVLLEVPSVIVPEESIVLINGSLVDAAGIIARTVRRYEYNTLFRG